MSDWNSTIRNAVTRSFEELFEGDAKIVAVDVVSDTDSDGEDVLRIKVVFESDSGKLNTEKASKAIRTLRTALSKESEERFPLLSFVAKADAPKALAPAAA